jgi:hypothetical protein
MPRHDLKNGMRNSFYADKQRTTLPNKKKSMMLCKKTLKKYTDVPQDTKHRLKKECADEAATHRRGGARRWPIWVVQLICELLVNGTSPAAIPSNIQTMYETLYGKTPDEIPSVNFVRGCRVVVQVIGKTITAIKLGNA